MENGMENNIFSTSSGDIIIIGPWNLKHRVLNQAHWAYYCNQAPSSGNLHRLGSDPFVSHSSRSECRKKKKEIPKPSLSCSKP